MNAMIRVLRGTCLSLRQAGKWRYLAVPDSNSLLLVSRCPYCAVALDFKPLVAHGDGRLVCEYCAHTVWPEVLSYRCICVNCLKWRWNDRTAQEFS